MNETLRQMVERIALPLWDKMVAESSLDALDGMTFKDFCDEIQLAMP